MSNHTNKQSAEMPVHVANKAAGIRHAGTFKGKSNAVGGGGRFAQLRAQGKSPALAAFIGRQSLGKSKFQALAVKGRARASK